jgi:hypothetical protein
MATSKKTTTTTTTTTTATATKVEAARSAVMERLHQGQDAAVVAAERLGATLERVIPAPVLPMVGTVHKVVVSNVEFAAALARNQADFAIKVAKAVLPTD